MPWTRFDVGALRARVDAGLPESFRGLPVRFGWDEVEPRHWVSVLPLGTWLTGHHGVDPRSGMATRDWLTVPQQLLLGVVRGAVYADPAGELAALRSWLAALVSARRLAMGARGPVAADRAGEGVRRVGPPRRVTSWVRGCSPVVWCAG